MSRVFIDYVAVYPDRIESGSITAIHTGSRGVIQQVNNTSHATGITELDAIGVEVLASGSLLKITLNNHLAEDCNIEYIYRGWK